MATKLTKEKLDLAVAAALKKVDAMMEKFAVDKFPSSSSKNGVYAEMGNRGGWTQCFYTGMLMLAYE